jgi:HlyD family secretion protein
MKRIYWILIGGVLLIAAVLVAQALKGSSPTEVYVEKAAKRDITEAVSATGKIQPETELKISSDVSGEITELLVKEGDQVKKGALLCRIRPDLYVSALERVNATVNTTRANLKSAEAQLEQAKAQLVNSESNFHRSKKLLDQNTISQQEFDAARSQYESAKANVSGLEENVNAAMFTIRSSEASLKEANATLEKTYIYSPVDATVSKLSVERGERVVGVAGMAGTEIMRLANLNEMEVSVEVNENDIIKVHRNDTANIEVDAYMDKKFKGIVTEIANSSNAIGTNVDQVTNFTVKIRMLRESYGYLVTENNLVPFRSGMSASVDVLTRRVKSVVSVPIQAVTVRNKDSVHVAEESDEHRPKVTNELDEKQKKQTEVKNQEYVFLLTKGSIAKQVEVKTGIQDNDFIEITSGVSPGDEIICGPYSAVSKILRDKNHVKVVKKEDLYRTERP